MAKNITAVWESCKALIDQANKYAADGGFKRATGNTSGVDAVLASALASSPTAVTGMATQPQSQKPKIDSIPKNIMDGISAAFGDVIKFVEQFLLSKKSAYLYGSMLIGTEIDINYSQRGFVDTNVKTDPITISFNPFFAKEDNGTYYTLNKIIGTTVQELLRLLYLHPASFGRLNSTNDAKRHSNLVAASDVSSSETVISDIVYCSTSSDHDQNMGKAALPNNAYTKDDLESELSCDKIVKSKSTLEYYFSVAEAYRKSDESNSSNPPDFSGSGSNNRKNELATPDNDGGSQTRQWESGADPDDVEDKLKTAVKEAYDQLTDEQKGMLPGNIQEHIKLMLQKPELNWRDILKKYIGIYPAGHRPTRQRLNRRQPERFDLSGQLSDKIVKLVICIDTSGSMSDTMISYCLNEVAGIVKGYKTDITVIECDAAVGKVYKVKRTSDIDPHISGRGGTSYVPAIEYINERSEYRGAVMIYFTDGYGDDSIPRPKTYRNLWVICNNDSGNYFSLDKRNAYGEVKFLKGDKKYSQLHGGY